MRLPDLVAYQAAVQHPSTAFTDPQLRTATVTTGSLGLPRAVAGNFAVTYQLTCGSRRWAVRCFHRDVADRASRYAVISRSLARVTDGPLVPIEYIDSGVRVGASWYPITKMAWLDGFPLNRVVESSLSRPGALLELERRFIALIADLHRRGIAHGDLQHGNVLVDDAGTLHLVDYDGMYVPGLQGRTASETGDPNYQHPGRATQFDADLDNFASLVIVVALRALAASPTLWRTYNTSDNLLFRRSDFADPLNSPLFRDLAALGAVRDLASRLAQACREDYARAPRLEDVLRRPSAQPVAVRPVSGSPRTPARASKSWRVRRATVQCAVAISTDGTRVASADSDGKITIRDASSGKTKTNLRLSATKAPVASLAFSRAGDTIVVTVERNRVSVWNVTQQRKLRDVAISGVAHAQLSGGGGWLALANVDGVVQCRSVASGRLVGDCSTPGAASALAVSADGRNVAVASRGRVHVFAIESGVEWCRFAVDSDATSLAVGTGRVLVGTARGELTLFDSRSGAVVTHLAPVNERVDSLALSFDCEQYAGAGANGSIWLRHMIGMKARRQPAPVTRLPKLFEWLRRVALVYAG